MYAPEYYQERDRAKLIVFMRAYPFAMLISSTPTVPAITHIPCILVGDGNDIIIKGHIARANNHTQFLDGDIPATIVFQGPHAYISPVLYSNPINVPTWNYIAVHASGKPIVISDENDGHKVLEDTIKVFDPNYINQYRELPDNYKNGLFKGIMPFMMKVEKLEGKFKLNQNKPLDDRKYIASVLALSQDTNIKEIGEYMRNEIEEVDKPKN